MMIVESCIFLGYASWSYGVQKLGMGNGTKYIQFWFKFERRGEMHMWGVIRSLGDIGILHTSSILPEKVADSNPVLYMYNRVVMQW